MESDIREKVISALRRLAVGCTLEERVEEYTYDGNSVSGHKSRIITKEIAPDLRAAQLILSMEKDEYSYMTESELQAEKLRLLGMLVTSESPPEEEAQVPPEETAQAPPEETAQAPPEEEAQAPPEETAQAPPEETAQAPPEEEAQAPPEEEAQAPPEEEAQVPPEAVAAEEYDLIIPAGDEACLPAEDGGAGEDGGEYIIAPDCDVGSANEDERGVKRRSARRRASWK